MAQEEDKSGVIYSDPASKPAEGTIEKAGPAPQEPVEPPVQPTAPSPGSTSEIPEEYLSDEDLYPTAAPAGTSPAAIINKKKPLLFLGIGGFVLVIIIIAIIAALLRKPIEESTVKLTYWGLWEKEEVMNEVIASYKLKHPLVEIDYFVMDAKDDYRKRLIERTAKGTGPDIFRYHNTWVPELTEVLIGAPETVFTVDEYRTLFYPIVSKDLIVENAGSEQIVGVPLGIDGLVLVYNETILKAAGFTQGPTNWEELLDIARKVTVKDATGRVLTAGIALGTAENISHFSDIVTLMFLQNGVNFKSFATDPNAVSVLDTYTNFALSANNVWDRDMQESVMSFANEKVAMLFIPTWQIEVIKHVNPDIQLKVISVPQITGGKRKSVASYWVEGVSKGSKNQKEAWEFLKFLTEKETLTKLYDLQVKSGRLFGYAYPRTDMGELLVQDPYLGPLIKDVLILDSFPLMDLTYDNGLNRDLVNYLKDAINSILANSGTRDALGAMEGHFAQVYTQFNFDPNPTPAP